MDVLGVSYGGAIGQELAYRHPEHVWPHLRPATMRVLGACPASRNTLASTVMARLVKETVRAAATAGIQMAAIVLEPLSLVELTLAASSALRTGTHCQLDRRSRLQQ